MTGLLPILTFHDLADDRENLCFPPALFALLLRQLQEAGREIVSLEEGVRRLNQGRLDDRPTVAITFDDGYRSVYETAFPLLEACGGTATIFLTTGREAAAGGRLPALFGRPMLGWDEIGEMAAAGMTFGAHTCTHPDLTRLPDPEIEAEMGRSKQIIEQMTGVRADTFAYPFGAVDRRVRDAAAGMFRLVVSTELDQAAPGADPCLLPRIDAYYFRHPWLIPLLTGGRLSSYLRLRRGPRRIRQRLLRLVPQAGR